MGDLIKLQCSNCQGRLRHYEKDLYECEYCNTLYKIKNDGIEPLKVTIVRPGTKVIGANVMVTDEAKRYGEEGLKMYTKHQLVHKMSEYLAENFDNFVDIEKLYDPCRGTSTFYARMRVLESEGNVKTFDDMWNEGSM